MARVTHCQPPLGYTRGQVVSDNTHSPTQAHPHLGLLHKLLHAAILVQDDDTILGWVVHLGDQDGGLSIPGPVELQHLLQGVVAHNVTAGQRADGTGQEGGGVSQECPLRASPSAALRCVAERLCTLERAEGRVYQLTAECCEVTSMHTQGTLLALCNNGTQPAHTC